MRIQKKKTIKRYDFKTKPIRPILLMWLVKLLAWIMRLQRKVKITYVGKKPTSPRLVLANHGAFNDFYILYKAIPTFNINYVVAIDAFNDFSNFLMRNVGAICKRKFIFDLSLMKNLKHAINNLKDTVVIYPEARYSLDGTTSYLPESLGKLVKYLGVPLTVINAKGNYVSDPQWNKYKQDRMPMEATVTEIVSAEEISTLSASEINERIKKAFVYDDWQWLKESGTKLTYKNRAYNLNAILYQCPHCKKEFEMQGEGTILTCNACKKQWEMLETGELKAIDGETEFSHIPDWFKWQKQNIHEEVFSGKYNMEFDAEVFTLPNCTGFVKQPNGKFKQTSTTTSLFVNLYGEDRTISFEGTELESVHIEYNYKNYGDMLDFSIRDDSVWLMPLNRKDVITKISLATEEIRDYCKRLRDKE
ncbi:MAG: hypothetical protein IKA85_08410 [Clostridia bacterium]|nr:hypothetical protein [Clostridia bacterium]MBR2377771.1 hypothetical protein [Clostridia bacterium]